MQAPAIFVALEAVGLRRGDPPVALALSGGQCRAHHLAGLLRRLGGGDGRAPARRARGDRARPAARAGALALRSARSWQWRSPASLLFAAEASHVALNPVFQLKLALIGAGLVNVASLRIRRQTRGRRSAARRDHAGSRTDRGRRLSAALGRGRRLRAEHRVFLVQLPELPARRRVKTCARCRRKRSRLSRPFGSWTRSPPCSPQANGDLVQPVSPRGASEIFR